MPRPAAWSPTSLADFVNCPRAYYEKRIAKSVVDTPGPEAQYGTWVHKQFELRQTNQKALPDELKAHEQYMRLLETIKGEKHAERRVALDTRGQPCAFFDKRVWFRCVIDFTSANIADGIAFVADYKTGKKHGKMAQLIANALYIFAEQPAIHEVHVEYYWTKDRSTTQGQYTRDSISDMWAEFLPDLRQYKEAFETDTWQPRQSGLCNGWCPVKTCEFWKPKRQF